MPEYAEWYKPIAARIAHARQQLRAQGGYELYCHPDGECWLKHYPDEVSTDLTGEARRLALYPDGRLEGVEDLGDWHYLMPPAIGDRLVAMQQRQAEATNSGNLAVQVRRQRVSDIAAGISPAHQQALARYGLSPAVATMAEDYSAAAQLVEIQQALIQQGINPDDKLGAT